MNFELPDYKKTVVEAKKDANAKVEGHLWRDDYYRTLWEKLSRKGIGTISEDDIVKIDAGLKNKMGDKLSEAIKSNGGESEEAIRATELLRKLQDSFVISNNYQPKADFDSEYSPEEETAGLRIKGIIKGKNIDVSEEWGKYYEGTVDEVEGKAEDIKQIFDEYREVAEMRGKALDDLIKENLAKLKKDAPKSKRKEAADRAVQQEIFGGVFETDIKPFEEEDLK